MMAPNKKFSLKDEILNALVLVSVAAFAFFVWRGIIDKRPIIDTTGAVDLEFPLAGGRFYVVNRGPDKDLYGPIHAARAEKYALDIVKDTGNPDIFGAAGSLPQNEPTFGVPVFSPCAGEVVWAQNNAPDLPVGQRDRTAVANSVTIECAGGFTVVMAHFKQGSVVVNTDDRIRAGDPVAAVGNSGNTTGPHLHIAAFRDNHDGSEKIPLPMSFGGKNLQKGDTIDAAPINNGQKNISPAARPQSMIEKDNSETMPAATSSQPLIENDISTGKLEDVTGTYERPPDDNCVSDECARSWLSVEQAGGSIIFGIEANRGAPGYNMGTIDPAKIVLTGNEATYKGNGGNCELTIEFFSEKAVITPKHIVNPEDDSSDCWKACGFGYGICVRGEYAKKSNKVPDFEHFGPTGSGKPVNDMTEKNE